MVRPGENRNLTRVLRDAFRAQMRGINTSIPAIVETFDREKRRAKVRPVVQVNISGRNQDAVPIMDVPVGSIYGDGFGIYPSLQPDDLVHLVFSQRGISNFKRTWENAPPDRVGFFSLQDAVAVAGLGPMEITPAATEGLTIQNDDGTIYINIKETGVTIEAPTITIEGNMNITGDVSITGNLTVNGQSVAAAPPGTQSASGPGSHSHGLTGA